MIDTYTKVISPVNLLESIPPNVSCPLGSDSEVAGANEMPTSFVASSPCVKALSVTVGTVSRPVVVSMLRSALTVRSPR